MLIYHLVLYRIMTIAIAVVRPVHLMNADSAPSTLKSSQPTQPDSLSVTSWCCSKTAGHTDLSSASSPLYFKGIALLLKNKGTSLCNFVLKSELCYFFLLLSTVSRLWHWASTLVCNTLAGTQSVVPFSYIQLRLVHLDIFCAVNCWQVASGSLLASGSWERFTGTTQRYSSPVPQLLSSQRKHLLQMFLQIYQLQLYNKSCTWFWPIDWPRLVTIGLELAPGNGSQTYMSTVTGENITSHLRSPASTCATNISYLVAPTR